MQVGFEFGGWLIRQCRVQPLAIVDFFDESANFVVRMMCVTIAASVDLLLLERLHEALRHRVVVRAANPAHARLDGVRLEPADVVAARVLHATIGMMDQAGCRLSRGDGLFQRKQPRRMARVRSIDHSTALIVD